MRRVHPCRQVIFHPVMAQRPDVRANKSTSIATSRYDLRSRAWERFLRCWPMQMYLMNASGDSSRCSRRVTRFRGILGVVGVELLGTEGFYLFGVRSLFMYPLQYNIPDQAKSAPLFNEWPYTSKHQNSSHELYTIQALTHSQSKQRPLVQHKAECFRVLLQLGCTQRRRLASAGHRAPMAGAR